MLDLKTRETLLREEQETFRKVIEVAMREDDHYALPGDKPLTERQKAKIFAFWKKYDIMGPVDLRGFQTYANRSGLFSPLYLPHYFVKYFFRPLIVPAAYGTAFQNKAYLPKLLANAKQPMTIVRKVEGIYYDSDFRMIAAKEAAERCAHVLKEGREIVVKPSGRAGGAGIVFLQSANVRELRELFRQKGQLFVVQEAIRQHSQMAALNPTTVNTVRLTTFMDRGKWIPMAALIKIGAPHMRVDNYKHGGCILGVNLDGSTLPWALNTSYARVDTLPSGIRLGRGGFDRVPGFESVLETARAAHYDIPRIKLISWDIAIDEQGEAEIIEANFGGDLRMHQVLTGPVLGDDTERILDWYFLRNYSRKGMTDEFDYDEYHDHVVITKYAGGQAAVTVPETLAGKPVTEIGEEAFSYQSQLQTVQLPDTVTKLRKHAFFACANLATLQVRVDGLTVVGDSAVGQCPKLDKACKTQIARRRTGAPKV